MLDHLVIKKEEYCSFFAIRFFFLYYYRCLRSTIRAEATLIGEWVSEWAIFFFTRRFCQCIVKTGQRTQTHIYTHINRWRTCSSSSSFFVFPFFYSLYHWLLVDFNKTIDVSTQLKRMQLSPSLYRLMATFCSRWLKAVVNNNESRSWLRHINNSSCSNKSSASNMYMYTYMYMRLAIDRSCNLLTITHHRHHYYNQHHIGRKKTYVVFLMIKISI